VRSSSAGDLWRTAALGTRSGPALVAAYASAPLPAGGWVAADLIDAWSDTVPSARQTTTAVFDFNGPAARAQQAVLLAVPADLAQGCGARLDPHELVEILVETRELAHARAAGPAAAGPFPATVPTATFPAAGKSAVRLDGGAGFPK
jgi:hypothetical protein